MKCRYCGRIIPEGKLYCSHCGKEVCIVPDYNPLDDMLTAQIKGAITGDNSYDAEEIYDSIRNTGDFQKNDNRRTTGRTTSRTTGRTVAKTTGRQMSERERRRRQAERRKAIRRKKRKRALLIIGGLLLIILIVGIAAYQTSYIGMINKGNKNLNNKDYNLAESYFEKALSKDEKRADAYIGLSKVYLAQKNEDKAESVFLNAIDKQKDNVDLYDACIQYYMDTDQKEEIPLLLEDAKDSVVDALSEYVISKPKFSLDSEEVYDDVQELTLTAKEGYTIYYTTDEKDPTANSEKYSSPIQIKEGETVIIAIAVNKDGIPSLPSKKTYTVELPVEDAPAVSPSTGQYESAMQIEIKVPDGYEAYYTMDKSDPTTASTKYTGPIPMPEGETIFKAILVNAKGRTSDITTRNYVYNSGN